MSQRLSVPLRQLVAASRRLAHGELDTKVEVPAVAELAELAESFNAMAAALRTRDEKLHDFATRRKIMESERLALIGQLAADVAHELNNPLQGIVTYRHLLRERGAGGGRRARLAGQDRQPGGPLHEDHPRAAGLLAAADAAQAAGPA